jgi:serine/threonine protein phosphatase PrpC
MTRHGTEIAHITLQGNRTENQDRFTVLEQDDCCLLVLADGLGGHPRGDLAAQTLVDTCEEMWEDTRKPLMNPNYFLQQCILHAHQAIIAHGARQTPPILPRTTAVLALLQEGECYWAHAGDSRFYLLREGRILSRSRDHVVTNEPRKQPAETMETAKPGTITRCLGGTSQSAAPELGSPITLQEKDIVLLCSDGFWNQIGEKQMLATLHKALPLQNALRLLAETAEQNGIGLSDNITAVGVRMGSNSYGIGQLPATCDEESELLMAIEHLNKLIKKRL